MEQKRVTFKVAKAIKEVGYPQICGLWYNKNGVEFSYTEDYSECYARPTYIDVWLWLWREKGIQIELQYDKHESNAWCEIADDEYKEFDNKDPEEAIIEAIGFLCENNLIK